MNENGTAYELDAEIDSPVGNNSYFGVSVGIYENSVIVGADGFRKSIFLFFFFCPVFGCVGINCLYNSFPTRFFTPF